MIIKCIPGGIFLTNCYIIGDEATNEAILVDPGEHIDDILTEVEKSGLDIIKIVKTVNFTGGVTGKGQCRILRSNTTAVVGDPDCFAATTP